MTPLLERTETLAACSHFGYDRSQNGYTTARSGNPHFRLLSP